MAAAVLFDLVGGSYPRLLDHYDDHLVYGALGYLRLMKLSIITKEEEEGYQQIDSNMTCTCAAMESPL